MTCVDITCVAKRLAEYYDVDQIEEFLDAPHPQLGGERPMALIAAGRVDEVHQVIDRLDL